MIKKETNGCGVDIVLNSLAEEKLHTSIRCLTKGGHFIELGKFDLANDAEIKMLCTKNEITFSGAMLDKMWQKTINQQIVSLVQEGIDVGYIKPLPTISFESRDMEKACRYMTTGKHIGKVVIKIRDENNKLLDYKNQMFEARPRYLN